jgi:hypothetical protein
MKFVVFIAALVMLSGCATVPVTQPLPLEVTVPIAVSCIKPEQVPTKPDYESLHETQSTPDGTLVLHVTRDFAESLSYQEQLEALITACR